MRIETLEILHSLMQNAVQDAKKRQGEAFAELRKQPTADYLAERLKEAAGEVRDMEQALDDFRNESWH